MAVVVVVVVVVSKIISFLSFIQLFGNKKLTYHISSNKDHTTSTDKDHSAKLRTYHKKT